LERGLEGVDQAIRVQEALDPAEGPERLARHAMAEIRRQLAEDEVADEHAQRVNALLTHLGSGTLGDAEVLRPPKVLRGIKDRSPLGDVRPLPPAPATPYSQSDLLVNAVGQPNIGSELRAELASAESVDLICAFVIWSGVRHLREALRGVIERGGQVRVVTTTYMGATEKRAVDELFSIGAKIRIAFDARTMKLHAKAWLLERESGLATAFVGSSNLSHSALFDGLEWNVRLSSVDAPHVVDRVRMSFESHWGSEHSTAMTRPSTARNSSARYASTTAACSGRARRSSSRTSMSARTRTSGACSTHSRWNANAMIATATSSSQRPAPAKTVVAALDYRHLLEHSGRDLSLLFVAHREEILRQSLATYRAVLRRGDFGEIHGGGQLVAGHHVFAMVQSLHAERLAQIAPDAFDVLVVDEFHHAAADTYDRLLRHLCPGELLGLTATPERLDGRDVTEWFDQRIAVELRLWEAIDQGFLVPFQYFGIPDGTDLRQLTWRRGGYATEELSNLLSNDDLRVGKLLEAINRIVLDPASMRALGFCVSKTHAHFMARRFTEAGMTSVALTGDDAPEDRRQVLEFLERHDHSLVDVYCGDRCWTRLRREAGRPAPRCVSPEVEARTLRAIGRLTHLDDPERGALYRAVLRTSGPPRLAEYDERHRRLLTMLAWGLGSGPPHAPLDEFFASVWQERAVRKELIALLDVLDARSATRAAPSGLEVEIPLTLHARYSRAEIIAAVGFGEGVKPKVTQGGILWAPGARCDVFFVDLHKAERDYSPTTMYRDYAINREFFHWESQSRQTPNQPTVRRDIEHQPRGSRVLLFVRERKNDKLGTQPFYFLGPVSYVDHRGERPVAFTWRLPAPMPEELFEIASSVAAA
jgi:HKD family nuclease